MIGPKPIDAQCRESGLEVGSLEVTVGWWGAISCRAQLQISSLTGASSPVGKHPGATFGLERPRADQMFGGFGNFSSGALAAISKIWRSFVCWAQTLGWTPTGVNTSYANTEVDTFMQRPGWTPLCKGWGGHFYATAGVDTFMQTLGCCIVWPVRALEGVINIVVPPMGMLCCTFRAVQTKLL